MGRKRPAGLFNRNGKWHIDKQIGGLRICTSCGTGDLAEAEIILAKIIEENRQAQLYGIRPKRTFEQAAAEFIKLKANLKSLDSYISKLRQIIPYIGHVPIDEIHQGTLDEWVEMRREQGRKTTTINHGLKVVRFVLKTATEELQHPNKLTWLSKEPLIKLLPVDDARVPYPITWEEQETLLKYLPVHLKDMVLFAVNTGCRDQEICHLRWDWELPVDKDSTSSVFVIPPQFTKNNKIKFVYLNKITREVIERRRDIHPEFVFSYRGNGLYQMNNTGWQDARVHAGLPDLRVHDLRDTFSTRMYELGVPHKDVRILMGHSKEDVTDKYIHAAFSRLNRAVAKLEPNAFGGYPKIILLRLPAELESRKFHAGKKKRSAA